MRNMEIQFLAEENIPEELRKAMDAIDHVAFATDQDDPELAGIQWSSHEWMAVGLIDGKPVTQLCLTRRKIRVGDEMVWVAGVGGVATHPDWQKRGLATRLLGAIQPFIRDEVRVPFGLLICAEATRPLYEHIGWQWVSQRLYYIQEAQRRHLDTQVLILAVTEHPWINGEIDVCGLPW